MSEGKATLYVRIPLPLMRRLEASLAEESYRFEDGQYVRRSMQRLTTDLLSEALDARSKPAKKPAKKKPSKKARKK